MSTEKMIRRKMRGLREIAESIASDIDELQWLEAAEDCEIAVTVIRDLRACIVDYQDTVHQSHLVKRDA